MDNLKKFESFLNEEIKEPRQVRLLKFKKKFELIVADPPEGEEENEYQENEKYQEIYRYIDEYDITIEDLRIIISTEKYEGSEFKHEYDEYLGVIIKELKEEGEGRKPGLYHVKFNDEWTIAQYNKDGDDVWDIIGSDGIFTDKNFSWIGEIPINVGPSY